MIATHDLPQNVLSVTTVHGYDTIFRDTVLSKQLGLEEGDMVPGDLARADILLWVESDILENSELAPEELRRLREELGMTQEGYANYVCLPPEEIIARENRR